MKTPFVLLLILLLQGPAWAGPGHPLRNPAGEITLGEALALALEQSPELQEFSWEIRAADARILQAGLKPNPVLAVEIENAIGTGEFSDGDMTERRLQLSQAFELGGKRAARVEEARWAREMARWDYQMKRLDVLRDTTLAFVDVLAAQRLLSLAEENVKTVEAMLPFNQQALETGQGSAVDVSRTEVLISLTQVSVAKARRELLAAKAQLASRWGATAPRFSSASGRLDPLPPLPALQTLSARLQRNPQLARWTTEREKRRAALELARANAVPDLTVMAGPMIMGHADDVTGMVGFSLPLPLFDRNQGRIAEAEADIGKVEAQEHSAEARAHAALRRAYHAMAEASEEAALLSDKVLPQAGRSVDLLTQNYSAGEATQIEILDARRVLVEARIQHLKALADYHRALAEVEALTAAPAPEAAGK